MYKKSYLMFLSVLFIFCGAATAQATNSGNYVGELNSSNGYQVEDVYMIIRLRVAKVLNKNGFKSNNDSVLVKKFIKNKSVNFPLFATYQVLMGEGNIVPIDKAIDIVLEKTNTNRKNKVKVLGSQFTFAAYGEINGLTLFIGKSK